VFTGIVEELGELLSRRERPDGACFTISAPLTGSDARAGDSISVNGVCLTVVDVQDGEFSADVIGETLRRSSLGAVRSGDRLNLERAAKLGDRLGGHLVQGHVDGTGTVLSRTAPQDGALWELIRIGIPPELARYVVEKGSIAVDGVSLTVIDVAADEFSVGLIPTTQQLTTLGLRRSGELVNLEVDIIAKYVERMMSGSHRPISNHAGSDTPS
jgi:riboflavin synthase